MAYSEWTDVQAMIGQQMLADLSDVNGTGEDLRQSSADQSIRRADAEIDGYVGARYQVPVVPVPDIIRTLSCKLAVWDLHCGRIVRDGVPKELVEMRRDAIATLRDIQKGLYLLPDTSPALMGGERAAVLCNKTSADRVFNRETVNMM